MPGRHVRTRSPLANSPITCASPVSAADLLTCSPVAEEDVAAVAALLASASAAKHTSAAQPDTTNTTTAALPSHRQMSQEQQQQQHSPASCSPASPVYEQPAPTRSLSMTAAVAFPKVHLASLPPRPSSALSRLLSSSPDTTSTSARKKRMQRYLSAPDMQAQAIKMDLESYERSVSSSTSPDRRDSGMSVSSYSSIDTEVATGQLNQSPVGSTRPRSHCYADSVLNPELRFVSLRAL